jgi:hypothetical protein
VYCETKVSKENKIRPERDEESFECPWILVPSHSGSRWQGRGAGIENPVEKHGRERRALN